MTPEAAVKKEIKAYLESIGAWWFMPSNNGRGRNGVPDFVVCHQGKFVGIEAKAEHGVLSPWQAKELQKIREAGGIAIVARGARAVETVKVALTC